MTKKIKNRNQHKIRCRENRWDKAWPEKIKQINKEFLESIEGHFTVIPSREYLWWQQSEYANG